MRVLQRIRKADVHWYFYCTLKYFPFVACPVELQIVEYFKEMVTTILHAAKLQSIFIMSATRTMLQQLLDFGKLSVDSRKPDYHLSSLQHSHRTVKYPLFHHKNS